MKRFLFILFVVSFNVFSLADVEISGTPDEVDALLKEKPEKVVLSGQVNDLVSVREANLTLLVEFEDEKLHQAISKLNSMIQKIEGILVNSGFSKDALEFGQFSSTPNYGFFSKSPNNYSVVNKVHIQVQSDAQFVEVAKLIDLYTELRYSHIDIETKIEDEARDQAILDAISRIEQQKSLYEDAFGIELGFERFDTKLEKKEAQTQINLMRLKEEDEGFIRKISSYSKSGSHLTLVEYEISCRVSATYHNR